MRQRASAGPRLAARPPGLASRAARRRAWSVAALAGFRAVAYRTFAALLLHPDRQRLQWLGATARQLRPYDEPLAAFAFFGPWRRLLDRLEALEAQDLAALQSDHVRLFNLDSESAPCFPYESCYLAPTSQDTSWLAVQLQHTYARAGLSLAPTLNERPDHAAVELEFMASLCRQEAEAWERAAQEDGLAALAQQRLFLRVHLERWFGPFTRQVRARAAEPLYALAAEAAEAFVTHDGDLVEAMLGALEPLGDPADSGANNESPMEHLT